MKRFILLCLLFPFTFLSATAQSVCSKYYPLVEGATMQYTIYNKNNKEDGSVTYKVVGVNESGDTVSANMEMTITDKKGNAMKSEYGLICENDVVSIDFKSLMNEQMLSQFGEMEVDMEGTNLIWPNTLNEGQELPDANIYVTVKMGGAMNMNMNVETFNRKVERKETITTPAGTFDCFVIYSETKTKMMLANQTFPSRMWLAEDVGMVKQVSYNKSGKPINTALLTQYNK